MVTTLEKTCPATHTAVSGKGEGVGWGWVSSRRFDNILLANRLTLKNLCVFFLLFRRKLTHDASRISMDVKFYYKFPCTSEKVSFHAVKYTNHPQGTIKWVSQKSFYQEVCKEGESVNIGNIQHKVCNPGNPPHMYCFTKTKTRYAKDLLFDLFLKRNNDANWSDLKRTQKDSMYIKYGVGCDCGWQFHTGDSDESRTGEQ